MEGSFLASCLGSTFAHLYTSYVLRFTEAMYTMPVWHSWKPFTRKHLSLEVQTGWCTFLCCKLTVTHNYMPTKRSDVVGPVLRKAMSLNSRWVCQCSGKCAWWQDYRDLYVWLCQETSWAEKARHLVLIVVVCYSSQKWSRPTLYQILQLTTAASVV